MAGWFGFPGLEIWTWSVGSLGRCLTYRTRKTVFWGSFFWLGGYPPGRGSGPTSSGRVRCAAHHGGVLYDEPESLILAQSERWRHA